MQEATQEIVPEQSALPVQVAVHMVAGPNVVQILSDDEVILALNLCFPLPKSFFSLHFNHLQSLIINLDIMVPSYITDHSVLFFLALISSDQIDPVPEPVVFGPALPPGGLKLVPYSDSDDEDDVMEIQECPSTTRKRRRRKMREPLERKFVRRSVRLNPDVGGFKDASSQQQAADNPLIYSSSVAVPSKVAPYLSMANIQGIATNFLQIQPQAVSPATLLELDDDE
ncbi:unnamed protein product [Urochloa humidicola]